MSDYSLVKHYTTLIRSLKRDHSHGGAPHKPILLLAIFSLIRKGIITSNRIEITPELVLEFKEYWSQFVVTPHVPNFSLPFFHMRSEPFWKLVSVPGIPIPVTSSGSIKSFKALKATVMYAELDQELFRLLLNKQENYFLSSFIIDTYFKHVSINSPDIQPTLFNELEMEILMESREKYQNKIDELQHKLTKEEFEEELFVRGGVFKREVPKLYNYSCAISGMRIESDANIQMVDACHIVPFAISKDDTIRNGICLSPNLHRAFDRGLITISADFIVLVSPRVIESPSPYSILQFSGKRIQLPPQQIYNPDAENLSWHRREVFLG